MNSENSANAGDNQDYATLEAKFLHNTDKHISILQDAISDQLEGKNSTAISSLIL
jgi:hypothetical protein